MNYKEKREILKHIKLGVDEVFYINYDGEPLPLRPISSYELDECFYHSLKYLSPRMVDMVIKLRLKLVGRDEEINPTAEEYISLQKHYDTISYWVVYYSMKDFQPPEFSEVEIDEEGEDYIPKGLRTIRRMKNVHFLSNTILTTSYQPKDMLKEIIKDEDGKEIAYVVYYLNQPLAEVRNITKLQRDYLLYSKGEIFALKPKKKYMVSGEAMTMEKLLNTFGVNTAKYAERG